MHDILEAIIHKAPVIGLRFGIGRSGLCIGDPAEAHLLDDGRVGIVVLRKRRLLGIFQHRALALLGHLGPTASAIVGPALRHADHLRIRIVGITPEHLAGDNGPEVHISVWADARRLSQRGDSPLKPVLTPPDPDQPAPPSMGVAHKRKG